MSPLITKAMGREEAHRHQRAPDALATLAKAWPVGRPREPSSEGPESVTRSHHGAISIRPMSFPTVVFDQMIRQLGELVQLRDQALRRTEVSTSDALSTALQALKRAVSAVGRVAEIGDREAEVAEARRALVEARGLFGEVEKPFREAPRPAEGDMQRQVP